jgi:hypothetical protein
MTDPEKIEEEKQRKRQRRGNKRSIFGQFAKLQPIKRLCPNYVLKG